MNKYIYIDDEDIASVQSIIDGLNGAGIIEVFRMPLKQGIKTDEIYQDLKTEEYDGIIMDYMLNGGGPYQIGSNSNPIAQYVRDLAEGGKSCPIVLCSTNENLQKQLNSGYTSNDLYDYQFEKSLKINYKRESELLDSLANGYKQISNSKSEIRNILARDIAGLDPRPFEPFMCAETIQIKQCADLVLQDFFKYAGMLMSEDVLCARLGIAQTGSYADIVSVFAPAKYSGVFNEFGQYYWTDIVNRIFYDIFGTSLASVDAVRKIELLGQRFTTATLELAPMDEYSVSKNFWTVCDVTKVALDPMEGYRLKEKTILKPWQEPRYVSFSALSDGLVEVNKIVDIDVLRYNQKVEYLTRRRNESKRI